MLTISLHGIQLHAPHGLYSQEAVLGNDFEVDAEIILAIGDPGSWPFVDYTEIHSIVRTVFLSEGQLLETFVRNIYLELRQRFPDAAKIKVAVRKMHPPLSGAVAYSQVRFED